MVDAKPFKRLLLTGAAGTLGSMLRERLKPLAEVIRLSDLAPMASAGEGEEVMECDLADLASVQALLDGVDVVVHFGGVSVEAPFAPILQANILGMTNLYQAVHQHGVGRVIFASSNHAVGFYRTDELVDASMPLRPDGLYGVSKCFGEALSRYYFDRFGIETVCLRIGSCCPEPLNARMLSTWCSYGDLVELLRCSLLTENVGHTIVFGVSDNPSVWWDNKEAAHLGYLPIDSSASFSGRFNDESHSPKFHGGPFIPAGPQYSES